MAMTRSFSSLLKNSSCPKNTISQSVFDGSLPSMNTILTAFGFAILSLQVQAQSPKGYRFSKEISASIDTEKVAWNLQEYAIQFSRVGNYRASLDIQKEFLARTSRQRNALVKPKVDSLYFSSFRPIPAVAAITAEASKFQVVITNEAHYQPQNRVFTSLLLDSLYKKGFRYFCPESLSNTDPEMGLTKDTALNRRKYPILNEGYYIDEPRYGDLIRRALQIGYTVLAYEHIGRDIKDPGERFMARERGQADNIAHILEKDPSARILVHCGYGHLNEQVRDSVGLMAAMLKLYHHIDPLTVDQQDMLEENGDTSYSRTNLEEPSVFIAGSKYFADSNANHIVDLVVYFPRTKYINGRPNWLVYDKKNKYAWVGAIPGDFTYPLMLLAYHAEEDRSVAVPADIIEWQHSNEKIAFVLTKGDYVIEIKDMNGHRQLKKLSVK